MNRTGASNSRDAAVAVMGATPGDMLDHIIERAEVARARYLDRLSEPQLLSAAARSNLSRSATTAPQSVRREERFMPSLTSATLTKPC